jgi:RNA polymerase sigma factor (sigma-70 family)
LKKDLSKIYQQHRGGLFSLAASLTGCAQQAEDAVHTAFEKLCRQTHLKTENLTIYVFAAVRNSAIDLQRHQRRQSRFATSLFNSHVTPTTPSDADESVLTAERNQILRTAIEGLESDDREIVVRKYLGS